MTEPMRQVVLEVPLPRGMRTWCVEWLPAHKARVGEAIDGWEIVEVYAPTIDRAALGTVERGRRAVASVLKG